jgi:pimeloyl-ACP methyl ester carboxylesterase
MQSKGKVKVGLAAIEFLEEGSGDTVVIIPAGGLDANYFDDFARRLARAGFRAVAVNPRGTGESTGPLEGLTLHAWAADVVGVIETLDCGPVHVLGHALGQRVARCVAADRPDLVRSVIMLAAGGLIPPEEEARAALLDWFRDDATEDECLKAMEAMLGDARHAQRIYRQVGRWPAAAAAQLAAARATPPHDYDGAPSDAPYLIVQGLADRAAPPENGRALRDRFGSRIRLVEIPRAGHMLVVEQTGAVVDAVLSFLRDQREALHGSFVSR